MNNFIVGLHVVGLYVGLSTVRVFALWIVYSWTICFVDCVLLLDCLLLGWYQLLDCRLLGYMLFDCLLLN